MADNVTAAGNTYGTDEVGGVHYSRIKLVHGDDGSLDGDVSNANPLPAQASGDVAHDAADSGKPVKVGGVARAELPAPVADGDRANASADQYGRLLTAEVPAGATKSAHLTYTGQQNGAVVVDPADGKRIKIRAMTISVSNTMAGKITTWFGPSGVNDYVQGAHKAVDVANIIPGSPQSPGSREYDIDSDAANEELKVTTSAAISFDMVVHYAEF